MSIVHEPDKLTALQKFASKRHHKPFQNSLKVFSWQKRQNIFSDAKQIGFLKSYKFIGVQVGGPTPPPLKNLPPPMPQKFDITSLFTKHHKGFSWQNPKIFFGLLLNARGLLVHPFIVICPLSCTKNGHFFMKRPFNIVKKASQNFWTLQLIAIFRQYSKWNGETARSNWKKYETP